MNETVSEMIRRHEGRSAVAYVDSVGVWTVGYGHNLMKPLSERAMLQIFQDDLADATNDCLHAFPWFADLDEPRKAVMLDMCFNLGLPRLQKFVKFLAAMEKGDYDEAAKQMIQSHWYNQVAKRADELVVLMQLPVKT